MEMPKSSEATIAAFRSVVEAGPDSVEKKMFGQLAGFVNGNMFMGTFGDQIQVRLSAAGRDEALRAGAIPFEPMGRAMKEYVVLPPEVVADPAALRGWVAKAYQYVSENVPSKAPKEPRSTARKR